MIASCSVSAILNANIHKSGPPYPVPHTAYAIFTTNIYSVMQLHERKPRKHSLYRQCLEDNISSLHIFLYSMAICLFRWSQRERGWGADTGNAVTHQKVWGINQRHSHSFTSRSPSCSVWCMTECSIRTFYSKCMLMYVCVFGGVIDLQQEGKQRSWAWSTPSAYSCPPNWLLEQKNWEKHNN